MENVKTVLIVDDEEGIAELAARILDEYGFGTIKAFTGEEAVAVFKARAGDVAVTIMDMGLPGISGLDAMAAILAEFPAARVVISSGSNEEEISEALNQGAFATLGKPYRMNALVDCVRGAVDGNA